MNAVRLWCRHATPQCARRFGYANFLDESGLVANSIWAQIMPYKEERAAVRYLVYLMGGDAAATQPLRR